MEVVFVQYDNTFLEKSWGWLNTPEIAYLTQTPVFSKEDQLHWFESLKEKNDYMIWGIRCDNIPVGVCGLKNINISSAEYWGYIGEKEYWGKGIGKKMLTFIENEAIKLDLCILELNVLKDNVRALHLYEKQGFVMKKIGHLNILMAKEI